MNYSFKFINDRGLVDREIIIRELKKISSMNKFKGTFGMGYITRLIYANNYDEVNRLMSKVLRPGCGCNIFFDTDKCTISFTENSDYLKFRL